MQLLVILAFVYAIISMYLFETYTNSEDDDLFYRKRFSNLLLTFFTLFQLLTYDHWFVMLQGKYQLKNIHVDCTNAYYSTNRCRDNNCPHCSHNFLPFVGIYICNGFQKFIYWCNGYVSLWFFIMLGLTLFAVNNFSDISRKEKKRDKQKKRKRQMDISRQKLLYMELNKEGNFFIVFSSLFD